MKRRIAIIALSTPALAAGAQEALPVPAPAAVTWNIGAVSDYRYRGISQTRLRPALQGGADWADPGSGLYAGTWLSTISWAKDAGGGGHVEWDVYAGRKGELGGGVSYDLGVLGYVYPGNGLSGVPGFVNADTGEIYGQLGYGAWYAKYSHALSNLFGFPDSQGSGYLDLGANLDAGNGVTAILHAGRQRVAHNDGASYTDWKLGIAKAWGTTTLTLAAVGTNAGEAAYTSAANGKFLGRKALLLSAVCSF
jgi:uncharacterized protein (TIGR02001 family)